MSAQQSTSLPPNFECKHYSIELFVFKCEDRQMPLIRLVNHYGLPYNASLRHILMILDDVPKESPLGQYLREQGTKLSHWEEDIVAMSQYTSKTEIKNDAHSIVAKIKNYSHNLILFASRIDRQRIISKVDTLIEDLLGVSGDNFSALLEALQLLPAQSRRRAYLKNHLKKMTQNHTERKALLTEVLNKLVT